MALSPSQLAQDIAFERYLLDEIAPALDLSPGRQVVYFSKDLPKPRIDAIVEMSTVRVRLQVGGQPLKKELDISPLVFGASWKVFDVVIDSILGPKKNGDPRTIESKCREALNANGPARPNPFTREPEIWKRYMRLYANTMDLRHSIVHRKITARPDGSLETIAAKNQTGPGTVMTKQELGYFFRAAQGFYDALLSQTLDSHKRVNLLFILDQLKAHHGLGPLPGRELTRQVLVLAELTPSSSGRLEFDADTALTYVQGQWPAGAIDLLLRLPDGTVLKGHLEDAPTGQPASIRGDRPPRWLKVVPNAEWAAWDRR